MKKLIALLMAICMLFGCAAFAEAPAATETEPAQPDPQEQMAEMVDQYWYTFVAALANGFNAGVEQINSILTQTSGMLNSWLEAADARYQENRASISDSVTRLLTSASEVVGESRYIGEGFIDMEQQNTVNNNELTQAINTIVAFIQDMAQNGKAREKAAEEMAQTRLGETKNDMIDSANGAISSFAEIASDLIYIFTGAADSNAVSRGIPGAEGQNPVTEYANQLQDFLSGLQGFLDSLKDELQLEETAPAANP